MTSAPLPDDPLSGGLHLATVRPGDAPVAGPLAAAAVRWDDWRGRDGVHLLYADLDLAERDGLRRELGLHPTDAAGDRDLVVQAFERWGDGAPDHLGGQFGVAVWDGRRQAVLAARDPIGLRPFVWARTPDGAVLGGDIRAVLAADGVPDTLDDDIAVASLLDRAFDPVMVGRTHFRAVDELRGGHRLAVSPDGPRADRYWRPEDAPALGLRGIDEIGEALRALLREVTLDAVDGGRVGGHLSSGLDSSAVMALAAEALGAPPTAFSWQPPPGDAPVGEHHRIAALVERWGFPLVWCPPTVEDYVTRFGLDTTTFPEAMWSNEQPTRLAAVEAGVTTLLSGWGGDEGVSYSGRGLVSRHLIRSGRWGPLAASFVRDPVHAVRRLRRRMRRTSVTAMRPPLDAVRQAALRGDRQCFVRPDVLRRATLPEFELPPTTPRAYQSWVLRRGHLGRRAGDWARAGAPYGLRYRYPLLDRRVLAFAQGLPAQAWLSYRKHRRWPLRAAAAGLVPDAVRFGARKLEPAWLDANQAARAEAIRRCQHQIPAAVSQNFGPYLDLDALYEAVKAWGDAWRRTGENPGGPGLHAVRYIQLGH